MFKKLKGYTKYFLIKSRLLEIKKCLEITTTVGCKIQCIYCPQDKFIKAYSKRSSITQMCFDEFKVCLNKIPLNVVIDFSGMSEPWLNPDCTNMLLYAHKRGYRIRVYTTLVGLSLLDIDLFKSIPFEHFSVHLPSDEGYEKIKVNENYLNILDKISKSNISNITYHIHGERIHSKLKGLISNNIEPMGTLTRAGNTEIKINNSPIPHKKTGILTVCQKLYQNILLPNGDVILCCMDYGMYHILGNLLSDDYPSLFKSKEFLNIQKGLGDDSLDILCRNCEYSHNENALLQMKYYLFRFNKKLINIHSLKDFYRIVKNAFLNLKNHYLL
jgi:hypothetical protein